MPLFSKRYKTVSPDFIGKLPETGKILVIDIAGLGDLVHALPAFWAIRQALPRAELHCIANARWSSLLRIAPWIDRVWDYHERPKAIQASDWALARLIRRERFDACINLMGSNRSCIISRLSGAPYRLGRKPFEERRRAWRRFNTHVMEYPYRGEPRYQQKWKCLQQAGIGCAAPHFEIELRSVTLPADLGEEHRATYAPQSLRQRHAKGAAAAADGGSAGGAARRIAAVPGGGVEFVLSRVKSLPSKGC